MLGEEALAREFELCPHLRNGLAGNHLALGKIAILPVRKPAA
jgi:hypothetical protein